MNEATSHLWTIDELVNKVAEALAVDYPGQDNGQVRDVPDTRSIRYYTFLGLLARPAVMRGRTGLYNQRHLLQLVAIKRLQADGKPLAAIQQQMLGLTDSELATIAKLPLADGACPEPEPRSSTFWMETPAPVAAREPMAPSDDPALQTVPLADNVSLVIRPERPLTQAEIKTISVIATPVLLLLEERGLI